MALCNLCLALIHLRKTMRKEVINSISLPKQFLFAPYGAAMANMLLHVPFILVTMIAGLPPLLPLISAAIIHFILIGIGEREPDLPEVMKAWFKSKEHTKNIVKSKARTFNP